jgi:hypothetical protein
MFGTARRYLDETVKYYTLGRIASGTSEVMKYIIQRDAYQEVLGRKEGVGEQILMKA